MFGRSVSLSGWLAQASACHERSRVGACRELDYLDQEQHADEQCEGLVNARPRQMQAALVGPAALDDEEHDARDKRDREHGGLGGNQADQDDGRDEAAAIPPEEPDRDHRDDQRHGDDHDESPRRSGRFDPTDGVCLQQPGEAEQQGIPAEARDRREATPLWLRHVVAGARRMRYTTREVPATGRRSTVVHAGAKAAWNPVSV